MKMDKQTIKKKIIDWVNEQSVFSIIAYLSAMIGTGMMIDGIFFVPLIETRYGFDNYSLNKSMMYLLFALIANNSHKIKGR